MSDRGWHREIEEIRRRQALAAEMGGPERVERQRSRGKLTVRERIAALLDPASFREWGSFAGEGRYSADGSLESFRASSCLAGRALRSALLGLTGAGRFAVSLRGQRQHLNSFAQFDENIVESIDIQRNRRII